MPPRIVTARSMGLQFRTNQLARMGPEKSTVGHYSATPRARDWRAGIAAAKSFHRTHQNNGWAGIGYHYVIPDDGAIICCRSTSHIGAHVLNNNSGRIGINMPGTTGDRPTKRQARSLNWLLHNAHTTAMPRAHRTDRNLSTLPRFVHNDLMPTSCPGLFKGMYKRGGDPWIEPVSDSIDPALLPDALTGEPGLAPSPVLLDPDSAANVPGRRFVRASEVDDGFAALDAEDEDFLVVINALKDLVPGDDSTSGPDEVELVADDDDEQELPPADPDFDQDLSEVLAEIEAAEAAPVG